MREKFDIRNELSQLAQERPIFFSEADFQFSFAWRINTNYPEAKIRLEYPISTAGQMRYLDMRILLNNSQINIELKYKTRTLSASANNEQYKLKNQGAQDIGRYDFLKDVSRLESFQSDSLTTGYAILLTNDPLYWEKPSKQNSIDKDFKLTDGLVKSGKLQWMPNVGIGTTKGREAPIQLRNNQLVHWTDYSIIPKQKNSGRFRYLLCST